MHERRSVDVEPGPVLNLAGPVLHGAGVVAAVLDPHPADVDVGHHVPVDRYVLSQEEPETQKDEEIKSGKSRHF